MTNTSQLLNLPRELREEIWSFVCHKDAPSFGHSAYDLLRTCEQLRRELAPYLYESVTLYVRDNSQMLHWVAVVGTYNSSCIRRLVLRCAALDFSRLRGEELDKAFDIWSSSLAVMLNLCYLIYHYEPSKPYEPRWWKSERPIAPLKRNTNIDLMAVPQLTMKGPLDTSNYEDDTLQGYIRDTQDISHAVLAVDEPIPHINAISISKILGFNSDVPLEQNITRLPPDFLASQGLYLTRTCVMTDGLQKHTIALTYSKLHSWIPRVQPNFKLLFSNLPRLGYLRLGCPTADSTFLTYLPPEIRTLDVAFKDPDPANVARNLRQMRERCQNLYTLAIAVSPLHDEYRLPDGGRLIDQASAGGAGISHWEPFWEALRYVQSTGVKVWEGDGPSGER